MSADEEGVELRVKENRIFWSPDYEYKFDPDNYVSDGGDKLHYYGYYSDEDYVYRY
jgi:hypothetical protein